MAVSKNDNTSALLTKLDEHHKRLEEQMLQLENEQTLQKENEASKLNEQKERERFLQLLEEAKQEKTDHTINQERLTENIRSDLEKEYAEKEKMLVQQVNQNLKCNLEQKTEEI